MSVLGYFTGVFEIKFYMQIFMNIDFLADFKIKPLSTDRTDKLQSRVIMGASRAGTEQSARMCSQRASRRVLVDASA